jgi:hypothetical protein
LLQECSGSIFYSIAESSRYLSLYRSLHIPQSSGINLPISVPHLSSDVACLVLQGSVGSPIWKNELMGKLPTTIHYLRTLHEIIISLQVHYHQPYSLVSSPTAIVGLSHRHTRAATTFILILHP